MPFFCVSKWLDGENCEQVAFEKIRITGCEAKISFAFIFSVRTCFGFAEKIGMCVSADVWPLNVCESV